MSLFSILDRFSDDSLVVAKTAHLLSSLISYVPLLCRKRRSNCIHCFGSERRQSSPPPLQPRKSTASSTGLHSQSRRQMCIASFFLPFGVVVLTSLPMPRTGCVAGARCCRAQGAAESRGSAPGLCARRQRRPRCARSASPHRVRSCSGCVSGVSGVVSLLWVSPVSLSGRCLGLRVCVGVWADDSWADECDVSSYMHSPTVFLLDCVLIASRFATDCHSC